MKASRVPKNISPWRPLPFRLPGRRFRREQPLELGGGERLHEGRHKQKKQHQGDTHKHHTPPSRAEPQVASLDLDCRLPDTSPQPHKTPQV